MSDAIVKAEQPQVAALWRTATDVAGVCGEIVKRTAQNIQGRQYVRCEGWQAIANAFGCVASARDVRRIEADGPGSGPGGYAAIGEVRRMSDGMVLATAEGFVGDDEKTWSSRPAFAQRAMAQTRAISRACRSAFAFVVTLIDSSLQTTPAEEMEGIVIDQEPVRAGPSRTEALKEKLRSDPPPKQAPKQETKSAYVLSFGKHKGKSLDDCPTDYLEWLLAQTREQVESGDPKWKNQNEQRLTAIEGELAGRG